MPDVTDDPLVCAANRAPEDFADASTDCTCSPWMGIDDGRTRSVRSWFDWRRPNSTTSPVDSQVPVN